MDWSHGLEFGIGVFLDWSFGNKTLEYSVDRKFNSMRDICVQMVAISKHVTNAYTFNNDHY